MAKTHDKPLQFRSVGEWRQASMTSDVKEFLERCDAERQEDISTTIKSRVEEMLALDSASRKGLLPKGK